MDKINPFSNKNSFVSYPSNFNSTQKTIQSLANKDILAPKEDDINKEIAMYLDILYKDTDEDLLKPTDKLKISSAYAPLKYQKNESGIFYL